MRAIRLATVLMSAFVVTSASFADTIEVDTFAGKAEVPVSPKTIAVFDIAALDTLNALGVSVAGAPERVYVDYLYDAVENAEKVGSLFEPDFEAINALQPDLIIAGGRSSKQVDALSKLAPTIDMTIWDDVLPQVKSRLYAYGQIFGKQAKAKQLDDELMKALEEARNAAAGAGKALIVLTQGPKVSVYGPKSRFGWIHSLLGVEAAIPDIDASTHGEAVSFEFIREANPDWLIVIDRAAAIGQDAALAAETLDNKLVADTTAWKNDQVVYLDAAKIYIAAGGYKATMDTIGDLTSQFSKTN
ncbi:MAG: siderophore ABC transporter substrate-binding protein [Roseibium sp.]